MNKMLKYLPISLILVFYVSGCGMLANRIEDKIELVGSELTGVSVDVDEVSLHIARGQGEIKGFKIANPEGYTADYLMDWQLMELNLGILSTVAGDPIVLDKLVISYPVVNFEKNKRGGSNLKDVAENTKKNTNIADQKSIEEDPASGETPEEPVRIKIRELIIEGITLNVLRADGSTRSAILPSIRMTDVGGDEGKTPAGLGVVIIGAMSGEMIKQIVARELIERAGDIQEALSTENILEVFDNKLNLTPGQRDKIRPIIESLSTALTSTIDIWVIQGYVNLDEFGKQLVPLKKDLEIQLKNVLDSRQFKDIKGLLSRLEDNATEIIRYAVVKHISVRLGITPEQLTQIWPSLREHMIDLSGLLQDFVAGSGKSFEKFEDDYEKINTVLFERLKGVLDSDQLDKLIILQREILDRIRTRNFTGRRLENGPEG